MDTNSVLSILLRYVNGQYKKDTNYDIALEIGRASCRERV